MAQNIKRHMKYYTLLSYLFICYLNVFSLSSQTLFDDNVRNKNTLRICFYNLENLFDPDNDSLKNDDEFTLEGLRHWTYNRLNKKIAHLAKVIIAMGGWEAPELVGICEVENENVIKKLIYNSPLATYKYKYVHYDSPDERGIDVAFLYRPDKFEVVYSKPIKVYDSALKQIPTRNILYIKGVMPHRRKDSLHLFINHWPSRYSGYAESQEKRIATAKILRLFIDSLLCVDSNSAIVVMGDFNDYPDDMSIRTYLMVQTNPDSLLNKELLNMMYPFLKKNNIGTHKYAQHWGILDQIMVSQPMFNNKNAWQIKDTAKIFDASFLLEADEKYMGVKPYRSYYGMKYQGGFSDHLPIFIDILCQ